MDDVLEMDGWAQAELLSRREVSPVELARASIERANRLNPQLNALVCERFEKALARASLGGFKAPFHGAPATLKDLSPLEGAPFVRGARAFRDAVSETSGFLAQRMERAGLNIIAKTSTSELGLSPFGRCQVSGDTRNPWNLLHDSGGSSAGAAVSVASGMVAFAQAGDGGGSIRIPASACGLVGLKPTRGYATHAPNPNCDGFLVYGAVTKSVRDAAMFADAICGAKMGDRWRRSPTRLVKALRAPIRSLKIALAPQGLMGLPVSAEVSAAVRGAGETLEALGHAVVEDRPSLDGASVLEAAVAIFSVGAARVVHGPGSDASNYEPWTRYLAQRAMEGPPFAHLLAWEVLQNAIYAKAEFFRRFDVIVAPVSTGAAPLIASLDPDTSIAQFMTDVLAMSGENMLWNASGWPAIAIPLTQDGDGLPIGVQLMSCEGQDARLIRLAAQMEEARPWAESLRALHRRLA